MADVITVRGLVKDFGRTRALDGLDLTVNQGEVHGFLGPNGAGKSTTIRILLGLLRPTAGTVRLLDGDPWADATVLHRRLAYVPGEVNLWPQLTGGEVIDLLGRLRGGVDQKRRDEMLQRFELDPTKKGTAYSRGNRQKVALVAALASDAELLILDEPTTGLDPLMEEVFAECIHAERQRGRTVFLSSHILSEVEALCDRVSIIRQGRNVETGSLAEMRHVTETSVDVTLRSIPPDLARLPAARTVEVEGTRLRCEVPTEQIGALLTDLGPYGIVSLTCQPPTLEELFLRHYDRNAGVAQPAPVSTASSS
jgi:ABC-2 type transport system ATP-binding protein